MSETEEQHSFCELLEAVAKRLDDTDGSDLCDGRHLVQVGLMLIAVGTKLTTIEELGINVSRH